MENKKRNIFIGIFALILIPIVLVSLYLSNKTENKKPDTAKRTPRIAPTESTVQKDPVPTNPQEVLLDRFDNRRQLSERDIQAKENIIATIPGQESGVVYQSATITIEYTKSADLFQVEVNTREINPAKEEAVSWLKSQGMSQEGICYAPVQFYPSFDVLQELKQQNIEFNPLAPGC